MAAAQRLTEGKLPRTRISRDVAPARRLRQQMTLPEVLLWNLLRRSPDGVSFRRQHPIDRFVVDFYCAKAKLCIEIDGAVHDMGENPERDGGRDAVIRGLGLDIVHIAVADGLKSPQSVADALVSYCKR